MKSKQDVPLADDPHNCFSDPMHAERQAYRRVCDLYTESSPQERHTVNWNTNRARTKYDPLEPAIKMLPSGSTATEYPLSYG